jgi:hypothetical protein
MVRTINEHHRAAKCLRWRRNAGRTGDQDCCSLRGLIC